MLGHAFLLVPAQRYASEFLATFKAFPTRQTAASFSIHQGLELLQRGTTREGVIRRLDKPAATSIKERHHT
jgi:hypothetical protein